MLFYPLNGAAGVPFARNAALRMALTEYPTQLQLDQTDKLSLHMAKPEEDQFHSNARLGS